MHAHTHPETLSPLLISRAAALKAYFDVHGIFSGVDSQPPTAKHVSALHYSDSTVTIATCHEIQIQYWTLGLSGY
jgi:hypothetical protein